MDVIYKMELVVAPCHRRPGHEGIGGRGTQKEEDTVGREGGGAATSLKLE